MSEDLQRLENWVAPLLAQLQPAQRGRLSRSIGMALRRSQQQRIAQQRNPDGSAYAPRKKLPAKRAKAGRIKRQAMFAKLRQAKHLRVRSSAQEVSVGFVGRVARIARVHHDGRSDVVRPGGPQVSYPKRKLLGFTDIDSGRVREMLLEHLTSS